MQAQSALSKLTLLIIFGLNCVGLAFKQALASENHPASTETTSYASGDRTQPLVQKSAEELEGVSNYADIERMLGRPNETAVVGFVAHWSKRHQFPVVGGTFLIIDNKVERMEYLKIEQGDTTLPAKESDVEAEKFVKEGMAWRDLLAALGEPTSRHQVVKSIWSDQSGCLVESLVAQNRLIQVGLICKSGDFSVRILSLNDDYEKFVGEMMDKVFQELLNPAQGQSSEQSIEEQANTSGKVAIFEQVHLGMNSQEFKALLQKEPLAASHALTQSEGLLARWMGQGEDAEALVAFKNGKGHSSQVFGTWVNTWEPLFEIGKTLQEMQSILGTPRFTVGLNIIDWEDDKLCSCEAIFAFDQLIGFSYYCAGISSSLQDFSAIALPSP